MSCNGCRVLRKGCSDECMLRQCLQWIENPEAQGHATLFVAKFFGRAALMSSLSSVPANQRSAMFRSLLYEAVGRSINPVNGAVGLLWTGNWHLCHMGVEKVLRGGGGALTPLPRFTVSDGFAFASDHQHHHRRSRMPKTKRKGAATAFDVDVDVDVERAVVESGRCEEGDEKQRQRQRQRASTPSEEDSHTATTLASTASHSASQPKLLTLFF